MEWIQYDLGANMDEGIPSWSEQFLGSLNLWPVLEGTHVLTLMLFAGTIWLVDLRMLGIAFKDVPFSKVNEKILPYTIAGFIIMILTGVVLFLAKPMDYYHSMWFRLKMIFLLVAAVNIFIFHHKVEKTRDEWDTALNPPNPVKISAIISMVSWLLIILFGRWIAYNWFECGKPQPGWVNFIAECSTYPGGALEKAFLIPDDSPVQIADPIQLAGKE